MTRELPAQIDLALQWVREEADAAQSGQGGHDTMFRTACTLVHGFDLGDADLMVCLETYNATKCVPPWTQPELMHKLSGAKASGSKYPKGWLYRKMCRAAGVMGGGGSAPARREVLEPRYESRWKLNFDVEALRAVQPLKAVDEAWLASASPRDVRACSTADFLNCVFEPDDMVLVFTKFGSQGQYMRWRGRCYRLAARPGVKAVPAELPTGGPDGVWFLSQPVSGTWKPNPREVDAMGRPKLSRRSEESVAAWRHLVLEADPVDEVKRDPKKRAEFERMWLGFLASVPLPVKAIYTSGGKSTHALIALPCPTKERFDARKKMIGPLFSKLGADPAAMKAVQLTRLPGCMRGNQPQRLLYLNPAPDPSGVSIIELQRAEGGAL